MQEDRTSSMEACSSFHDVTVLAEPLVSEPPPKVRVLRFGFQKQDADEECDVATVTGLCGLTELVSTTWRSMPAVSDVRSVAVSLVPCLDWMLHYDVKHDLKGDVVAGLSVGFMIIPQGMAYARVAGLPSIYGLYTGFVPCLLYSIFGSSRQLALGPTSLVSLLVGEAIKQFVNPDDPSDPSAAANYLALTLLLSLMMGAIQLAAGLVRMGWMVRFLSHAVVSGFSSGAAIILGLTQMRYFMGYMTRHETIHMIIYDIICNLKAMHYPSLIMGSLSLAFLLVMKHLGKSHKKLRVLRTLGPILASAIATLVIYISANPWGIRVTGQVPQGLPSPFVAFPFSRWRELLTPALVISSASYLESIGIAKTLAARNGYTVDANQELVGLGIANLVGACFQAFPTGGSFSRSAVSDDCGAKTSLAGMVSVLLVLFTLIFLTPVFQYLPLPVLGAILLSSVAGLVDHEEAWFLWRVDRKDFAVWMLAFCGTLFFGIEVGVAVAVLLSLGFVINESANAGCEVLGRLPGTTVYRSVEQYPDAKVTPGIVVVRFHSHLYFANVNNLRDSLREYEGLRGTRGGASLPKWPVPAAPSDPPQPHQQTHQQALQVPGSAGVAGGLPTLQPTDAAVLVVKSDSDSSASAAAQVLPFLEEHSVRYVIIDMTSVHGIDGAACHALKEIAVEYNNRGIKLALTNPNRAVMAKLERTGIPDLIGREWFFVRVYDAVKLCRAYMALARSSALGDAGQGLQGLHSLLPVEHRMPPELEWRQCSKAASADASCAESRGVVEPICRRSGYQLLGDSPSMPRSRVDLAMAEGGRGPLPPPPASALATGAGGFAVPGGGASGASSGAVTGPMDIGAFISFASIDERSCLSDDMSPSQSSLLVQQDDNGRPTRRRGSAGRKPAESRLQQQQELLQQGQQINPQLQQQLLQQGQQINPQLQQQQQGQQGQQINAQVQQQPPQHGSQLQRLLEQTITSSLGRLPGQDAQPTGPPEPQQSTGPALHPSLRPTSYSLPAAPAFSTYIQSAPEVMQSDHVLSDQPEEESAWVRSRRARRNQSASLRAGGGTAGTSPGIQICQHCKGVLPLPEGGHPDFEPRHVLVDVCQCCQPSTEPDQ